MHGSPRIPLLVGLLVLVVTIAATLVLGSGAAAGPSKDSSAKDVYIDFRMPSNNIFCAYVLSTQPKEKWLRCDIMSGIKPKPKGACKYEGDRGVAASMGIYGKASFPCTSDTVYNTSAPKLGYGKTWRRGGFVCVSKKSGLRCRNKSAHGFFLSRQRSYRF